MITRPIFKPSFHVEPLGEEGIILLNETAQVLLRGRLYCALAPLLDGRRVADELIDLLADEATPAQVYYALMRLEQQGYLAEADGATPPRRAAFWSALGAEVAAADQRVGAAKMGVTAFGAVDRAAGAAALAELGLRLGEDADYWLVLADDYLQEGLAAFNARALEAGTPWLLCKPVGMVLWVGPFFRRGATGCWACLAQRLAANREVEGFLQRRKDTKKPLPTSRAALPSTVRTALDMAATELARWLGGGSTPLEGIVLTVDLASLETQKHTLVRRPQCPHCGDPAYREARRPAPIVLESRTKRFTADGGHRAATPEETLRRYGHHVSPITGAVSMLQRSSDDGDDLLNCYVAGHNFALSYGSLHSLRRGLRSKSGGKGMTDPQARASGLCEAIERYSGLLQGHEVRRRASYRQLGEPAIHPNACMLYSERQYRDRERRDARGSRYDRVPLPFDEAREVDWTPLWSLTRREFRYLPTAYCYYGYPSSPEETYCSADSNGNAAGNTLEEAILQGFLELVERDSVALWWYNRPRRPAVDLDSFDEPYIARLREHYRTLGRDLWALDITSDLGIPSFVAASRRMDQPRQEIIFGFGAHFDPRIGLLRALTEQNQSLPMLRYVDSSGEAGIDDPATLDWLRTATVENQPYVAPAGDRPPVRRSDYRYVARDDLRDDVLAGQRIVERLGLEMLVLDQTRPDIGLPVAKVVVPGLRHFWARFGPGRLYEAPVRLGWLREALDETQLNPIAMFF
jgi:oxazoline/thiazoline synthase